MPSDFEAAPWTWRRAWRALAVLGVLAAPATASAAAPAFEQRFPIARPTPVWLLAQAIPSPIAWLSRDDVHFGLGWQITPALWSFAVRREVPAFRFFVADPLARHGGSVETFLAPEHVFSPAIEGARWVLRAGLRVYAPLLARGEALSVSAGASVYEYAGRVGASYEAGAYTLFGYLGLVLRVSPHDADLPASLLVRVRPL